MSDEATAGFVAVAITLSSSSRTFVAGRLALITFDSAQPVVIRLLIISYDIEHFSGSFGKEGRKVGLACKYRSQF